jgi:hypothetical protein
MPQNVLVAQHDRTSPIFTYTIAGIVFLPEHSALEIKVIADLGIVSLRRVLVK